MRSTGRRSAKRNNFIGGYTSDVITYQCPIEARSETNKHKCCITFEKKKNCKVTNILTSARKLQFRSGFTWGFLCNEYKNAFRQCNYRACDKRNQYKRTMQRVACVVRKLLWTVQCMCVICGWSSSLFILYIILQSEGIELHLSESSSIVFARKIDIRRLNSKLQFSFHVHRISIAIFSHCIIAIPTSCIWIICKQIHITQMDGIIGSCSISQCRLCAIHGFHKVDIFDGNTNELANKIFRCVGIRVNQLTLF